MKKSIVDGATPKVTTSASESSSFPIGDDTISSLADIPSKKSKAAPITIHRSAVSNCPWKAKDVAMHPEMRLQEVMVLGICFFTFQYDFLFRKTVSLKNLKGNSLFYRVWYSIFFFFCQQGFKENEFLKGGMLIFSFKKASNIQLVSTFL